MNDKASQFAMQEAWERASALYLARRGNDVHRVSYGNLAPDEAALGLLGELREKRVLDLGCGGGQNSIACALAGANVVAVDFSTAQLAAAAKLASRHGVAVEWRHLDVANIGDEEFKGFDLVLAIQVLAYLDAPEQALGRAASCLRPGGALVMSIDHPLRDCFFDAEVEELSPFPVRDYSDTTPVHWNFAAGIPMRTHHVPLGEWIAWAVAAGLHLQRLIEALAPAELATELWPQDSALAPLANIPHTLIMELVRA